MKSGLSNWVDTKDHGILTDYESARSTAARVFGYFALSVAGAGVVMLILKAICEC